MSHTTNQLEPRVVDFDVVQRIGRGLVLAVVGLLVGFLITVAIDPQAKINTLPEERLWTIAILSAATAFGAGLGLGLSSWEVPVSIARLLICTLVGCLGVTLAVSLTAASYSALAIAEARQAGAPEHWMGKGTPEVWQQQIACRLGVRVGAILGMLVGIGWGLRKSGRIAMAIVVCLVLWLGGVQIWRECDGMYRYYTSLWKEAVQRTGQR